jgi:hypothetical protein
MKTLLVILVFLHGLITTMQSKGSFNPKANNANPKWLSWWPTSLGQSWLVPQTKLLGLVVGFFWIVSGIAILAAGLSLLGIIIPIQWWRMLIGIGASIALILLILYAHPLYVIGILANLGILIVLLWIKWPKPITLGY